MDLSTIGAVAFVVLLWVAALTFGRDSRDGRDWHARTALAERPRRLGD